MLEGWIDALDARLPPLVTFILPGGGVAAAALHQEDALDLAHQHYSMGSPAIERTSAS